MSKPVRRWIAIAFALAFWCGWGASAAELDLILRNGSVYDGSGSAAISADIGIHGNRIVALGDLSDRTANEEIDVSGLAVLPGFIDLHSHADGASPSGGLRSYSGQRRAAPNLVAQGVTTVVVNQDGRSPLDIARQRRNLMESGIGVNAALMIGHNTVRRAVMKDDYRRAATPEEIARMGAHVRTAMQDGAFGMTAGLEYIPGIWSTTSELVSLVQEIVPYDGVYIVHERSSGEDPMWFLPSQDSPAQPTMLDSILETVAIGELTGAKVVATHIKARGVDYWGKSEEMIRVIRRARDRGVRMWADQYPYTTSGSDGLVVLLPGWILNAFDAETQNYADALNHVLKNPEQAARARRDIAHQIARRGGEDHIYVLDHPERSLVGKSLADIAAARNVTPVNLVLQFQYEGYLNRFGGVRVRGFSLDEADVIAFMKEPWVATASDAGIATTEDGPVHARHYGTFPRKIHKYAIADGVISVEHAIRSMTSLPAEIMGFARRGRVAPDYYADLAVVDLDRFQDLSTFMNPHQFPAGVEYVFVNGEKVVDRGTLTWALPGQVLLPQWNEDTD